MCCSMTWTSQHSNNKWIVDSTSNVSVFLNYFEREVTVHLTKVSTRSHSTLKTCWLSVRICNLHLPAKISRVVFLFSPPIDTATIKLTLGLLTSRNELLYHVIVREARQCCGCLCFCEKSSKCVIYRTKASWSDRLEITQKWQP